MNPMLPDGQKQDSNPSSSPPSVGLLDATLLNFMLLEQQVLEVRRIKEQVDGLSTIGVIAVAASLLGTMSMWIIYNLLSR